MTKDQIKAYEEQLKPCPFCGGKARLKTWVIDLETYYIVCCRKCEVMPCTASHTNIKYAVKAWNKRGDKK
jgi:Lar family restriction alleviation protein